MGKSIAGALVGLISMFVASLIIILPLCFVIGTSGILEPETFAPTTIWLAILLVTGGLAWFLGGVITKVIAKDNLGTYILIGIIVLLSSLPLLSQSEPDLSKMPKPTMEMSPLMAISWSQINAPDWLKFVSPLISILGAFLGGIDRSIKTPKTQED